MSVSGERELAAEKLLVRHARARGGIAIKLSPTVAGVPDRLVILPGGRMFMVELKAPQGKLSPIQRHVHDLLRKLGITVHVLYGTRGVDDWFGTLEL